MSNKHDEEMKEIVADLRFKDRKIIEQRKEIERITNLLLGYSYRIWKSNETALSYDEWLPDFKKENNLS